MPAHTVLMLCAGRANRSVGMPCQKRSLAGGAAGRDQRQYPDGLMLRPGVQGYRLMLTHRLTVTTASTACRISHHIFVFQPQRLFRTDPPARPAQLAALEINVRQPVANLRVHLTQHPPSRRYTRAVDVRIRDMDPCPARSIDSSGRGWNDPPLRLLVTAQRQIKSRHRQRPARLGIYITGHRTKMIAPVPDQQLLRTGCPQR